MLEKYEINQSSIGLIGQNIHYSLSPKIHNFSARQLSLDTNYQLFDLDASEVREFVDYFWQKGGLGLNITQPHKRLVAELFGEDRQHQSVNCLYRGEHNWQATSTDGRGFARALKHAGARLNEFERVIVLGSGGAVSALVDEMSLYDNIKSITIIRRSREQDDHIKSIAGALKLRFTPFAPEFLAASLKVESENTLIIQATSAPLKGNDLGSFANAISPFKGVIVDIVYGKPSTFINKAVELGIPYQDGLPMLIEQARLSQELWWGKSADYQAIKEHLESQA